MHDDAYAALFLRLRTAMPNLTWTRKALFRDQVRSWPTGCLVATHQEAMGEVGMPDRWTQTATIVIHHKPTTDSPDSELNAFVDQVEAALSAQSGEQGGAQTTLGGAVARAWLQGPVITDQERDGYAGVALHVDMLR